ncbi:M20 metallopeptidase family protein [Desulfospira joergensenii]|uniref:M20 metallopeptidase family protein n=1 Tax=Desulfospira joergensenii TaxID=53329 RepID=UPI0003B6BA10|nr:M20 family metallopeptidase [Desulfospira joergensenii]
METPEYTFKHWLTDLRRGFHRQPELSYQEEKTTQKVCQVLSELNIPVQTFGDMTGAVGLIQGKAVDAPYQGTIALRADMDALPLAEMTGLEFASEYPGQMHACGHDANTAIALGVARLVQESGLMDRINGAVKFIFQPSEEKLGGALAMMEKGVLENPRVDRLIAGHMDPNFPVGQAGVFHRTGHAASDPFELVIHGRGSHGARPHKGRSPITAGAQFVTSLDTLILRHVPPVHSAVISVGAFHGGDAGNVIPEQVVIRGSVRTHDPGIREMLFREMNRLAKGIETMFEVQCDLIFKSGAPMGLNDPDASASLFRASADVLGEDHVTVLPFIMGSDDFYFFGRECPVAMMRLGCADPDKKTAPPLHSPKFDIHEDVLETGAKVLFRAIALFFDNQTQQPHKKKEKR